MISMLSDSMTKEIPEPSFDFYDKIKFEDMDDVFIITNLKYLFKNDTLNYLVVNTNDNRGFVSVDYEKVEEEAHEVIPPECPLCNNESEIYEPRGEWICEDDDCPTGVLDMEAEIAE